MLNEKPKVETAKTTKTTTRRKMKDKERVVPFEPEIFKKHHDKHIIDIDDYYKRGSVTYFSDISSRARSKSSERSRCERHRKSHHHNTNNNNITSMLDRNSNKTSDDCSSSYRSSIVLNPDEEEREFLEKNLSNFNISQAGKKPVVVYVGDGRSRVRRVVSTQARHVTVVSYSTRHKETRSHTSHHVTTVR